MILQPGKATGDEPEAHAGSEQILLLVDGELSAEVEGEKVLLKRGDVIVISPGKDHRFINESNKEAVTFNVYCPPEYPPGERT
ncbi:MAG: cupin protein [Verrucomicrobiaceae bacterium]|nr:cupin protein [Verrucomicrobiaceae bacterium]